MHLKTLIRITPSFISVSWLIWQCTKANWARDVSPYVWWIITVTTITTVLLWVITKPRSRTNTAIVKRERNTPTEKLIAKEVYTWKTKITTRERSVYAEPKQNK